MVVGVTISVVEVQDPVVPLRKGQDQSERALNVPFLIIGLKL